MGITIYYRGTLNNASIVKVLTAEITDICEIMKWRHQVYDDDWTSPVDAKLSRSSRNLKITGNLGLKGIVFQPHKHSEWVNLCFDKSGLLYSPLGKAFDLEQGVESTETWNSVKTQFAPLGVHIAIVKILKRLKSAYIRNLEVKDEGEYWETGITRILAERRGEIFEAMDLLEKGLREAGKGYKKEESVDDLVRRIEVIIRSAKRKKGKNEKG
jgi:hypothetical protein